MKNTFLILLALIIAISCSSDSDPSSSEAEIITGTAIQDGNYDVKKIEYFGCDDRQPPVMDPCADFDGLEMCWTGFINISNGIVSYPNLALNFTEPITGISWTQSLEEIGIEIGNGSATAPLDELLWRRQSSDVISFESFEEDKADCWARLHFEKR